MNLLEDKYIRIEENSIVEPIEPELSSKKEIKNQEAEVFNTSNKQNTVVSVEKSEIPIKSLENIEQIKEVTQNLNLPTDIPRINFQSNSERNYISLNESLSNGNLIKEKNLQLIEREPSDIVVNKEKSKNLEDLNLEDKMDQDKSILIENEIKLNNLDKGEVVIDEIKTDSESDDDGI